MDWTFLIYLIEFIGALIIVGYAIKAIFSLLRQGSIEQARLLVAEGAIMGLSFKLAGTLLKTIELHTWEQILLFSFVLALRTLLKRLFIWEQERVQARAEQI